MKIAVVAFNLDTKGGTQRQALSLTHEFKEMGHRVYFYTVVADYEKCYGNMMRQVDIRIASVETPQFSGNSLTKKIKRKIHSQRIAEAIARIIPTDIDFISCHDEETYKAGFYWKNLNRAKSAKIGWIMNDPPISYRIKPTLSLEINRQIFNLFELIYERRFLKAVDYIFVLDKRNKELVNKFYHRTASIIGSGVDFDYFYNLPHRLDIRKPVKILGVGILAPYRRFEDIIDAVFLLKQKGRDAVANIVGDTNSDREYAGKLKKKLIELNLENSISFLGKISDEDLLKLYHSSDIFIFPNHIQTFGLAPAEAMAAGLPVIVSKTAGFSEFITDGKEGLLVNPMSPDQIAEKIEWFIDNPDRYYDFAKKGQEFVKNKLSWKICAEKILNLQRAKG